MKTNEQLQNDVQDAIKSALLLNEAVIGVIAQDGVVTLNGVVDSDLQKIEAEEAAKNVSGVKAVIEEIEVQFGTARLGRADDEIARAAIQAIQGILEIGNNKLHISVENGWITLEGKLEDNCQKRTASDAVQNLPGVRGVINNIETMVETEDTIEKKEIESAFIRNRDLNKLSLEVEVRGNKAILSGSVDSIYQKAEAERTALNAPGVKSIVNNIVVNFVQAVRD